MYSALNPLRNVSATSTIKVAHFPENRSYLISKLPMAFGKRADIHYMDKCTCAGMNDIQNGKEDFHSTNGPTHTCGASQYILNWQV
jgi:hypothetical protein